MRALGLVITLILLGYLATASSIQAQEAERRAKPPKFNDATTSIIFFNDVFAEALEGERPAALGQNAQMATGAGPATMNGDETGAGEGEQWSKIISAQTIQDEVKRINNQFLDTVQNVRKFNGGGFEDARRDYTELAMLFQIVAQYDADVRWQEYAYTARDLFARAGFNCKVGTDNSFKEAKERSQDLEELVRGGSIATREADPKASWEDIADLPPLMQRLDVGFHQRLKKMTADTGEFNSNAEDVLHEAEIIAAIGHAMGQEGFEYTDDEDYVGYCEAMQQAALNVVQAVKNNDPEAGRIASGEVLKACDSCHEGYR
ncbi:cytochrome c [Blastopirellula marina]|uniref:Cytochrome C n=1 Tax=Blastopirellula marina TaxID=124 RepID=A0A2S8GRL1_9BACT|nr:cytochrome c [Blastopirellula marina]PQO47069.1 hypothetical protein C5Y93_06135 [Blastopirellula marina]